MCILRRVRESILPRLRRACALPADAIKIFVFHAYTLCLGIAAGILIARVLGPTQKGVLNLFSLLTTLITELGVLGLNSGLLYYLANRKTPLAKVHTSALAATLILGIMPFGFILAFTPYFAVGFQGLPMRFVWISGAIAPLLIYRSLWSSLMTGINRAPHIYRVNFRISVLSLLGTLLLWMGGALTAPNLIWLIVALLLGLCVYAFLYLLNVHGFRFQWDRGCLGGSFRYGAVVYLGVIFNFFHFRVDQIIVNYFQGPRGVGIYTVSVSWAEVLWLIDYAVINAALYNISTLEPGQSWELTKRLCERTSLLLALAGIALAAASNPLIAIVYGAEFAGAVAPLVLLLPGTMAWGAGRILSQFITYNAGKPHLCTLAAAVGSVLNLLGNLYSVPRWGLVGAAATSSFSYMITFGVLAVSFGSLRRPREILDASKLPSV